MPVNSVFCARTGSAALRSRGVRCSAAESGALPHAGITRDSKDLGWERCCRRPSLAALAALASKRLCPLTSAAPSSHQQQSRPELPRRMVQPCQVPEVWGILRLIGVF
ncbi:hypothetical protein DV515_00016607 [Chloebia gouldiae]|uniref:Uncharacterized protein n=1 Tax=Chloebia gouldiae TaxID=44316 RepID=A0A3L8RRJ4_CHLGU|nr:hypothetical protein DV515_00016607 [Chloebia gouldiae]